jgi:hypothetical protein
MIYEFVKILDVHSTTEYNIRSQIPTFHLTLWVVMETTTINNCRTQLLLPSSLQYVYKHIKNKLVIVKSS